MTAWRKSSFSEGDQGDCVEVADLADGGVALRDSKNPADGVLTFALPEWSAFIKGVRAGEFD